MADKQKDLTLQQGKSQPLVVRCETSPIIYKPITGIQRTAPAIVEAFGHGIPDGWNVAITNVLGMTEINAEANNIKERDYVAATAIDTNHFSLNAVNAAGFKAYVSGGYIQYNTPADLTGYAAHLQIRNKQGGSTLYFEMTTENGLIEIDTTLHTVTVYFDALDLSGFTWKRGYYELELYKTVSRTVNGVTTNVRTAFAPLEGEVTIVAETTIETGLGGLIP